MSHRVSELDLGLSPTVHAQLAAEFPSVARFVTRTVPIQADGDEEWVQAAQALETYILQNLVPHVRSGIDLYHDAGILRSSGSPRLDALLGNGYRQGQMIEFVGESGCGKTQVCLLAAAANAAAGVRVQYIDTGNAFSSHRIVDLVHTLPPPQQGSLQLPDVLAHVHVQKAFDAQALLNALSSLAGGFAEAAASGTADDAALPQLVIVDALPAVFAPILGRQQMQGNALMIGAARLLKHLAARHGLVVIVVNHLVGSAQQSVSGQTVIPQERRPALGDHWLPQPHARVFLQRQQGSSRLAVLKTSTVLPPGGSVMLNMDDLTETHAAAASTVTP